MEKHIILNVKITLLQNTSITQSMFFLSIIQHYSSFFVHKTDIHMKEYENGSSQRNVISSWTQFLILKENVTQKCYYSCPREFMFSPRKICMPNHLRISKVTSISLSQINSQKGGVYRVPNNEIDECHLPGYNSHNTTESRNWFPSMSYTPDKIASKKQCSYSTYV